MTLLGVTVWLWRTRREIWVLCVVGLPTVFMYTMSTWALGRMIYIYLQQLSSAAPQQITYILLGISSLLLILAVAMLIEALIALTSRDDHPSRPESLVKAAALR